MKHVTVVLPTFRTSRVAIGMLALAAVASADSRIAARYTIAGQNSETTILNKGPRQRLELGGDLILVRQTELKRTLQIHEKDKTYEMVADVLPPPKETRKGGIVDVTTTVTDTGEKKKMFGLMARHLKTVVDRVPVANGAAPACEKKSKMVTDGWYIDLVVPPPADMTSQPDCVDEIRSKTVGKVKLGFPVQYTITTTEEGADPAVLSMEVTSLETAELDAALFDPPAGFRETQKIGGVVAAAGSKVPGMVRIGVTPFGNKSGSGVDPQTFQHQVIGQLAKPGIESLPVQGTTREEAEAAARRQQCDYVLVADLAEFKKTAVGKVGGLLNRASSLTKRGAAPSNPNESLEARVEYQLVPLAGGTTLNGTAIHKTSGIDVKGAVQLAVTVAQYTTPLAMMNPKMFQMLQQMKTMPGGPAGAGGMGGMGMADPGLGGMMFMSRLQSQPAAPAAPGANPQANEEVAVVTAAVQRMSKSVLESLRAK